MRDGIICIDKPAEHTSFDVIARVRGILHMRRHMACMFKGLPHFRDLRIRMLQAPDKERLWQVFDEIVDRYGNVQLNT